jgi:hypothetical protein
VNTKNLVGLTPGVSVNIKVAAINSLNEGEASDEVTLTPAVRPTAPTLLSGSSTASSILLTWSEPANTGIGDTSISISAYLLEIDEGFGAGYIPIQLTGTTFTHSNVVVGHPYKYKVSAQNFMGWGDKTAEYPYSLISAPAKPENPPSNDESNTSKTAIHITYDPVENNGGDGITSYKVSIEDFMGSTTIVDNGLTYSYDTSALTLTEGQYYRFRYAAHNSYGTGPFSECTSILLAQVPGVPVNLTRIDEDTLPAGTVRIHWEQPSDDGGSLIQGYLIYIDDVLVHEATNTYQHDLTLDCNTEFKISVSAYNEVSGEGTRANITEKAASVPAKMNSPTVQSSSLVNIVIEWEEPSFDGCDSVSGYKVRRDNGPGTSYQTEIPESNKFHDFTGLLNSVLIYRFQVAAVNDIGTGEWSEPIHFYAASKPDPPTNFIATSSTSEILLTWEGSDNGGCPIEGYKLWMEDSS